MAEEASDPFDDILRSEALADAACRLPGELLSTYARLWEFETWLRMMVYVELRACYGDNWEKHLPKEGPARTLPKGSQARRRPGRPVAA